MKRIAIITARGGSKRIPRKNIKEFLGKPILAYSIEACVESGLFDTVMVSTDDGEIAGIARQYGAQVPFLRSDENSGDFATTAQVLMEVLGSYEKKEEYFDMGCCIYPTAPFVTAEKLKDACSRFEASNADSLIPVVSFSYPPKRGMVIRKDRLVFEYPQYMDTRSQDLETIYHDAGQFYLFKTKSFLEYQKLFVGEVLPYPISELEVQDIDTMTDWEIAELKYKLMQRKRDN